MLARGEGGHIVNTSSMAAVVPIPGAAIYITAKAALVGLSEERSAASWPPTALISAFCPGPVRTNIREGGRTRPERYRRDTGYAELELELEERPNSPLWMDRSSAASASSRNPARRPVHLHAREFREGAEERFGAQLASFPDEPLDEERADAVRFLLSNPIFHKVLEHPRV